jgi:hypothetical protein
MSGLRLVIRDHMGGTSDLQKAKEESAIGRSQGRKRRRDTYLDVGEIASSRKRPGVSTVHEPVDFRSIL